MTRNGKKDRRRADTNARQDKTVAPPRVESLAEEAARQPKFWVMMAAGAGALALCLLIYLLRLDRVVGLYGDDAWYVLLAKALANGQGYTLINSPSPGIMPLYPPAFPALLSLCFRLAPQFPTNLWLLKAVSIAAMLGVGMATYFYFTRVRVWSWRLALGIAVATVISPAFVFLATSTVMSECVFTLWQLLAIIAVERSVLMRESRRLWYYLLIGAALATAAFLTRSAAVALLAAVIVYLLKERLTHLALIFAAACALCVGPWLLYARAHAPTPEQRAEQNSYIVQSYATSFWQRKAGYPHLGTISLDELPGRMLENTIHILEYDGGALVLYPFYRAVEPSEGKSREVGLALLSLTVCLLTLVGFIAALRERVLLAELVVIFSVLVTVLWPFGPFRFILPLLPFALFYFLLGCRAVFRLVGRMIRRRGFATDAQRTLLIVASWSIVALYAYGNAAYIRKLHGAPEGRPVWVRAFAENESLIKWAGEHLPKDAILTTQNPALLHLYTGHKTVGSLEPARNWENWKRLGVRYDVISSYYPLPEPGRAEQRFRVLYMTDWMKLRILDLGEAATRQPWSDAP